MCGISLTIICTDLAVSADPFFQDVISKLKNRGPNDFEELVCTFGNLRLHFHYTVLHLRGCLSSRKIINKADTNVLLWNGEIFSGLQVETGESDTKVLFDKLNACNKHEEILSVFSSIRGPYAFAYYQANGFLWFGRDILGRRSLVWNCKDGHFKISSVVKEVDKGQEVPTNGIFCLDLNTSIAQKSFTVNLFQWHSKPSGIHLENSITLNHPHLCIKQQDLMLKSPFSESLNRMLPSDHLLEKFRFTNESSKGSGKELLMEIAQMPHFKETVEEFEKVLSDAVEIRLKCQNHQCKNCYEIWLKNNENECKHSTVGFLFSGGLDSIVIACLADRFVPRDIPIDLINIAFAKTSPTANDKLFDTPDRLTGRDGLVALKQVCPLRTWNFVEVNINHTTLISERNERIVHLLSPSCTVLDDSIGCALWFAAKGEGVIKTETGLQKYCSPARVLLLGMGADEQLGGYSRHRAKFSSASWNGLIDELSLEIDRIGSRNLGRDDRIIADHGVESRYPFLDENVVSFLNGLPVWMKMNLNYPRGVGEKLLLRLLAYKLGLTEASTLPKRAIQFGSRIAKLENSKEKGSDICGRLKTVL